MLENQKKHLILLYTLSTGIILTVVILGAFFSSVYLENSYRLESYRKSMESVIYKLQTESRLSHSWMSKFEYENDMILHIEDCGIPFLFERACQTQPRRDMLTDTAAALLAEKQWDIHNQPVNEGIEQSPVYRMSGSGWERYYVAAAVLSGSGGWQSILLLQRLPDAAGLYAGRGGFYLLGELFGILLLYGISRHFVGKTLKPVEESQLRQKEFLIAASHELRSPLSVIGACASSMQMDALDAGLPHPMVSSLTSIREETKRMARLIDDMLLLASSDAKTWALKKTWMDMDAYMIDTFEGCRILCAKASRILTLELPDEPLPPAFADGERITQVIRILVDNAISYTPPGTSISLGAYPANRDLCIEVADDGPGIPDEKKEWVFQRFTRLDSSRNDKKHFGLGLSIAKELMELQDGSIVLKDSHGLGCCFLLTLCPACK